MANNIDLTRLNVTTKLFTGLIFNSSSLPMLVESGLINVYIDDYGHRCKYQNCILFLFNTSYRFYPTLEEKVTSFNSFYDWYDVGVDKQRMLVFKVGAVYQNDFYKLKHMIPGKYSDEFKKVTNLHSDLIMGLDYSREIYRYNL
jgi:hypothetical protein